MTSDGRAETLWEACEMTCESIALRPKNYFQEQWATKTLLIEAVYGPDARKLGPASTEEACGTAYCRAGWMLSHITGGDVTDHNISEIMRGHMKNAGIPIQDALDLFSGDACGTRSWNTKDYVESGVRGLREFMAKHEEKLKAYRVNEEVK